jgi:predicted ATPase/DNA-binding SARP family transcriptional activator
MAHLALALLGPPQVTLDGRPVSGFDYDKVRALLSYLAVEADRPHRRDALAALLWPDQPDQPAHNSLRQALATLRRAIGDQASAMPFLQITREAIQFNPASDHDLDVAAFSALLAACERHPHRHPETCSSCARRLQEAITLYRGDFLAQFSLPDSIPFEEWALVKREQLHGLMLQALIHLADYHERHGAHEEARRYAQRQLELDPWNEAAHRQVMHAYALTGQRNAALRQYASCRRVLADELGVEPAAETTALYEQIKRGTGRAAGRVERPPTNLPAHIPLTPFVGREGELAQIADRIEHRECRLLTLVGPGGIGKTRLALQAAQEQLASFSDGVYFVPLAPLSSAEFLIPTIANALAFVFHGPQDPKTQLLAYLREKDMLLVLDNFEHLLDGADVLIDILRGAAAVTLLMTSREPLNLRVEWLLDIQGLAFPHSRAVMNIETYSAVRLFIRLASQVRASLTLSNETLTSIARICQLVEGMPLAIELAASWIRVRSGAELVQAIERGLDDLATPMRDVPERHRSIRAVFDYSWRFLSEHERRVLAAVSVFRGGFQHEAAMQVAEASEPILRVLVNKSLLRRNTLGRYDLHELVRQYAGEKLHAAGEADSVRDAHADYFLALAEAAEPELRGRQQVAWFHRLEVEHDNLRAALRWFGERGNSERLAHLGGSLAWFWYMRGHGSEGRGWLEQALVYSNDLSTAIRAKALLGTARLVNVQGDYLQSKSMLEASLALYTQIGDIPGISASQQLLGIVAYWLGDWASARSRFEESIALCREHGYRWGIAFGLSWLGYMLSYEGDAVGRALLEESLALSRKLEDTGGMVEALLNLGWAYDLQGEYSRAMGLFEETLVLCHEIADNGGISGALNGLGEAARSLGDYQRAATCYEAGLALRRELGDRRGSAAILTNIGQLALEQGQIGRATTFLAEAMIIYRELAYKEGIIWALDLLGRVAGVGGQPARAARLWSAAEALREALGKSLAAADRPEYDHWVADARAELGKAIFAAAWAEGRAMSLEQAIAEALNDEEPSYRGGA